MRKRSNPSLSAPLPEADTCSEKSRLVSLLLQTSVREYTRPRAPEGQQAVITRGGGYGNSRNAYETTHILRLENLGEPPDRTKSAQHCRSLMNVPIKPSKTHLISVATLVSVVGVTYQSISCLGVSDAYVQEDKYMESTK